MLKNKAKIITPLRYPGGKTRAIKLFKNFIPVDYEEFREPFVGGGSITLYYKQLLPNRKYWINDLNKNLFYFWKVLQGDAEKLSKTIKSFKTKSLEQDNPKDLFNEMKIVLENKNNAFKKAVAYYIINKTAYSGLEVGKFSKTAFAGNFTFNNIERLKEIGKILQGVKITNCDYESVIAKSGKNVFIYFDPPYDIKCNVLYGIDGSFHKNFDHVRFFNIIKKTNKKFLISYNNSVHLKERYKNFEIISWDHKYTMQWDNGKARLKKEILIKNY